MKNIYSITKGQLILLWAFGVIILFFGIPPAAYNDHAWLTTFLVFVIFAIIFYSIGWRNNRKNDI